MVKRNANIAKLQASYLFVDIAERKAKFLKTEKGKEQTLISLGIGDTTRPLPENVDKSLVNYAQGLATTEGYSGYPSWNGSEALRKQIAIQFYDNKISADEIVISDGSKPDLGRMQMLFNQDAKIAVQDPVYPAYVDGSVIAGRTGEFDDTTKQYSNVYYMPCVPENDFFPDLETAKGADVIFFCSPNNPTGTVATREQLTKLVNFAKENKSVIIFDSAYREFISDPSIPKSIYEIPGAKEVAIESSSFSKLVGFTGVRLGWTVCPMDVKWEDGTSVFNDWKRIVGTIFNGPSNVAEAGGSGVVTEVGLQEMRGLIDYYMSNAKLIKSTLEKLNYTVYGGDHSPYLWVKTKDDKKSWEMFDTLLQECAIVTTPGAGFGTKGEGFVRFSSFANRNDVEEACKRLEKFLK